MMRGGYQRQADGIVTLEDDMQIAERFEPGGRRLAATG